MCKPSQILVLLACVAGVRARDTAEQPELQTHAAVKQADTEIYWPNLDGVPPPPLKDKLAVAWVFAFQLHVFGLERCYLGNVKLGLAKGITLGGLGLWAAFDLLVVWVPNMWYLKQSIDEYGIRARFGDEHTFVTGQSCSQTNGARWFFFVTWIGSWSTSVQQYRMQKAAEAQANAAEPYIVLQA